MVNYQNGKIYKIITSKSDDIYIGSTASPTLAIRLAQHIYSYKYWKNGTSGNCSSYDLFEKYGSETCSIILIETYPCKSRDELRMREEYHRKKYDTSINIYKAHRTKDEYRLEQLEKSRKMNPIYNKRKYHCIWCDNTMLNTNKYRHKKSNDHLDNKKFFMKIINKK